MKKIVAKPITVPDGDYCWNGMTICEWFDNEGGHPTCGQKLGDVEYGDGGSVEKCDKCKSLPLYNAED
jgi:hypothetical protein